MQPMSRKAKTILTYVSVVPIALGMLIYLLDSRYPTRAEAQVIQSELHGLRAVVYDLKDGVDLGNCLALAERKNEPWQACMRQ